MLTLIVWAHLLSGDGQSRSPLYIDLSKNRHPCAGWEIFVPISPSALPFRGRKIYIYIYVCMYIYIHIYIYACIYVCVYKYIYTHTHLFLFLKKVRCSFTSIGSSIVTNLNHISFSFQDNIRRFSNFYAFAAYFQENLSKKKKNP